ncbi:MAG TPA: tRNA glutamyl-Q(34) synthetase GluQRS [Propionibacteriaceae bacterium]|nr:tRNA glutamyl-Q(34) synthetase GluQRS [Propionibacteriaceae bacterium]
MTSSHGAGRFAPSPTSDLHVGNLRTALLAWLFARRDGLRFLVRIEDLDQQRVAAAPGVASRQLADLEAIGVDWDARPVRQSDRVEVYRDALRNLDTYPCFCSRRDIAEAAQAPNRPQGASWRPYPGTCARLSSAQRDELALTRPAAIRVRAGGVRQTVTDLHEGEVTGTVDDFVLVRGDGTPAYNLASVVDDGLQGVTQVTRGRDLLDSAPRQAWLGRRLGFEPPVYAHVGLALNPRGTRLAKRDGAVTLAQLTGAGRSAEWVVGRLLATAGLPPAAPVARVLAEVTTGRLSLDRPGVWEAWTWPPDAGPDAGDPQGQGGPGPDGAASA